MDNLILPARSVLPAGEIVAMHVSEEAFMTHYAADYYEWVRGFVIKMSPVTDIHDDLTGYLRELFRAYFALNPLGTVRTAPFVMHLANIPSRREPDLQIILNSNPGTLTSIAMRGPADICIEVISPESVTRDHGEKLEEYEKGRVQEYWVIDPLRHDTSFYRRSPEGNYQRIDLESGNYQTPLLPRFKLHVPTFWEEPLPSIFAVVEIVKAMLAQE